MTPASLYSKRRQLRILNGTWQPSIIPAGHVAAHLRALVAAGRSRRWISRASGVHVTVVCRLVSGEARRVARHNAERLLALTYADRPSAARWGRTWVPAVGTRRRLEALACQGWSQARVAQEAGLHWQTLSNARCSQGRVTAATAEAVARVYERLARVRRTDQAGRWVQARARRRGYQPPAVWTPWTIDDPEARPLPAEGA